MRQFLTFAIPALALGCTSVGPCDEAAAREVVYDIDGNPAYAGQALMIQSCGGGGFCHSEGIEPVDRIGAPAGLDFDMRLASTNAEASLDQLDRLDRHQRFLVNARTLVWEAVSSGRMPPGAEGRRIVAGSPHYDRLNPDGSYTPLPVIETAEGRDILRNWLACRAPVIERTEPRIDGETITIGDLVPARPARSCANATWPSLYATILGGHPDASGQLRGARCALSDCHDGTDPPVGLDWSASDPRNLSSVYDVARRILATGPTTSELCGSTNARLIVPNDPAASLLYQKVSAASAADVCGDPMPLVGQRLPDQLLGALEAWIRCGACTEPSCECTGPGCTPGCDVNDPSIVPASCEAVITGREPTP